MTGRKRKLGPREPSGRLSRQIADTGTAEAAAHRVALVGGADPVLASSQLGIMFARGQIDAEQFEAGKRYLQAYMRAGLMLPHARAASLADWVSMPPSSADPTIETPQEAEAWARWRDIQTSGWPAGSRQEAERVAINDNPARSLAHAREGLEHLAWHFGLKTARAA